MAPLKNTSATIDSFRTIRWYMIVFLNEKSCIPAAGPLDRRSGMDDIISVSGRGDNQRRWFHADAASYEALGDFINSMILLYRWPFTGRLSGSVCPLETFC